MAAGDHLLGGQDLPEDASQQRDLGRLLGVRLRREEADEAALADHVAGGVELADADVVHVGAAVDRRLGDRLGDGEQPVAEEPHADRLRQLGQRARAGERRAALAAQEAEPGAGADQQDPRAAEGHDLVLAVAEEHEATVHQPVQEVGRGARVLAGPGTAPREPVELGGGLLGAREHRPEVVGHEPHVAEAVADQLLQPGEGGDIGHARDGDVHERLAPRAAVRRSERDEPPRQVALRGQDRVEQGPPLHTLGLERSLDGVDDERTVGHDRLDDRDGRVPALGHVGRRDRARPQLVARRGVEAERRGDERRHLLVGERGDVVLGAVEKEPRERLQRRPLGAARPPLEQRAQPLADDCRPARPALLVGRHQTAGTSSVTRTSAGRKPRATSTARSSASAPSMRAVSSRQPRRRARSSAKATSPSPSRGSVERRATSSTAASPPALSERP